VRKGKGPVHLTISKITFSTEVWASAEITCKLGIDDHILSFDIDECEALADQLTALSASHDHQTIQFFPSHECTSPHEGRYSD
jgi:hypothetical protein